ncbi:MAG TPA: thiamine pyrophosphate-binding protein [Chloroflexia bacterium]|nr:thiamine pyrophosphate-binding protein [Chloroflexia bacterium]
MNESVTGGEQIVATLKAAGVEVVFGIISIHNIPIYDAISRMGGIRVIPTRSEPGAVNMADGYARATGKLGVAITSTGAGAGNGAGALVEAQTAGTPLLHLTGQIDSTHVDQGKGFIHECKDQLGMLKAISKEAYRLRSRQALPSLLSTAIEKAFAAPGGVVSIELPIDLQKAKAPSAEVSITPPVPRWPDPERINEAVRFLQNAKRPLIWAGSGVIAANASAELQELAELLGAGVLTSQAGRGSITEDHPLCIGNFGNNPALRPFLEQADLLLAVGTRFRGQETMQWTLPLPATQIQVDADPLAIGRSYPATLGVVGDAKLVLRELINRMKDQAQPNPSYMEEVEQARNAVRKALRSTLGPYEQLQDDLRAAMQRDALLVRDVTISGTTWGSRLFPIYGPRQTIHAAGGGIGQGWQMALGAKLGQPERQVVALLGDGGFLVNCGEMATAAQENIAVVGLLFNDGGYGVLRNIQNKNYEGRNIAVDLRSPDFSQLAAGFGLGYSKVASVTSFKPVLEEALAANRPYLIEVDMAAIGPFAVPFAGPANSI